MYFWGQKCPEPKEKVKSFRERSARHLQILGTLGLATGLRTGWGQDSKRENGAPKERLLSPCLLSPSWDAEMAPRCTWPCVPRASCETTRARVKKAWGERLREGGRPAFGESGDAPSSPLRRRTQEEVQTPGNSLARCPFATAGAQQAGDAGLADRTAFYRVTRGLGLLRGSPRETSARVPWCPRARAEARDAAAPAPRTHSLASRRQRDGCQRRPGGRQRCSLLPRPNLRLWPSSLCGCTCLPVRALRLALQDLCPRWLIWPPCESTASSRATRAGHPHRIAVRPREWLLRRGVFVLLSSSTSTWKHRTPSGEKGAGSKGGREGGKEEEF